MCVCVCVCVCVCAGIKEKRTSTSIKVSIARVEITCVCPRVIVLLRRQYQLHRPICVQVSANQHVKTSNGRLLYHVHVLVGLQDNLYARYGQLDVALALRDQRVLNEALRAPRSTRRALRNPLTQRFPAVPLTSRFRCVRRAPRVRGNILQITQLISLKSSLKHADHSTLPPNFYHILRKRQCMSSMKGICSQEM